MSKPALYWIDEAAFIPDAMYATPPAPVLSLCRVCSLVLGAGVCREHGDEAQQRAHLDPEPTECDG